MATIEAGKRQLDKQPIHIDQVLEECIRDMAPIAENSGVALSTDLADGLPALVADARSMRQIVLNILSNAIKFTPSKGRVGVSMSKQDGDMILAVADTGIGIAADRLATVTEPFSRSHGDAHIYHEGTGLGLSIAKLLVDAHDGSLEIDSTVGTGTTVKVRLPLQG